MADRKDVVQGTLDLLVLRIIAAQPMHGWGVMQRLRYLTEDVFQVTPGSLFPALRRLEENGWAVRLLGSLREQPEGALLRDHEGGTEAAGPREAALEVHHHGRREGPGGRMRRVWSRLRAMLRRLVDGGARDEELSEELRAFVEHDAESKIRSGMTPEDARRAALIELGGAEQVKEHVREARAGARWEGIFRDIRYAMRSLGRAPGFSSSVIGNLSLGLAAMIVAFALINGGSLRRPSPSIQDPDRLVEIGILETNPRRNRGAAPTALADYPDVARVLDEGMPSLDGLASFTESDVAVTLPQPRSLPAAFVSPNYFDVLGVRPEIGRTFAPEEGGAASPVAIISRALWMREFGGDPSVIGRPIQAGGQIFDVIGVAQQGFAGTTEPVEGRRPLAADRFRGSCGDGRSVRAARRSRDSIRRAECGTVSASSASRPSSASLPARLGVARPGGDPSARAARRVRGRLGGTGQGRGVRPVAKRIDAAGGGRRRPAPFPCSCSCSPVSTPRTSSWCVPPGAAVRWRSVWRSARPGSGSSGN